MRILSLALILAALVAIVFSCTPQGDPAIASRFCDDFDRAALGPLWTSTGSASFSITDGKLRVRNARNHPLWLRRRLPRDVRVTFRAKSDSPDGDIKVEVFGDGTSHAISNSYTATSYVIIFGGWRNTLNVLARMDEHGADRVVGPRRPVEQGREYAFRIERRGQRIAAYVDDTLLVEMNDRDPLEGRGHDHFAFNNWSSTLTFDDLCIEPL
jgi:hypothetical protein